MARRRTFLSYEECSVDPPPVHLFSSYCRVCWPAEAPATQREENFEGAGDEASDSDDTSSDSTEEVFSELAAPDPLDSE